MVLMFFLIVNDILDDIFGESGDEEEFDVVVSQVLDEIGIEIIGKVKLSFIIIKYYIWKDFVVICFLVYVYVFYFKIIRYKKFILVIVYYIRFCICKYYFCKL